MSARAGSVAVAWIALFVADAVMRCAGFPALHGFVRRFPRRGKARFDPDLQRGVCSAVNRAAALYFRRVRCLQRSAAAACVLRLHGIPAEMVIAVQKMPFRAHAWVECDGVVVNDRSEVQQRFVVLERC